MRLGALLWATVTASSLAATPDILLHAGEAEVTALTPFQPSPLAGTHLVGQLENGPSATWRFRSTTEGELRIAILARCQSAGARPVIRLGDSAPLETGMTLPRHWDRLEIGSIRVARGENRLRLSFGGDRQPAGRIEVLSVELTEPRRADEEAVRARRARADTGWMRAAGFGIMLHWTRESAPAQGPRKPYAQAARDLDVEALARRLAATGAGFAVLTASHAFQDFPGPSRSLDAVLPGRTSERDLVADLAAALERRGMRLMLYHHPGSGADQAWAEASGLAKGDMARHLRAWEDIVAEAGERYGQRLAGWWFDDGATGLYPRRAPWESLHRAARAGHPGRVIGFNPWELPSVTPWQDFDCGEGLREPRGREGRLGESDGGVYPDSSRMGQQATACVMLEDDWIHREAGRMPSAPRWTEPELAGFLRRSRGTGLVPILNLEVTQEGLLNPESAELVRRASGGPRR